MIVRSSPLLACWVLISELLLFLVSMGGPRSFGSGTSSQGIIISASKLIPSEARRRSTNV